MMNCKKCGSTNLTPLSKTTGKIKKRGCLSVLFHGTMILCTAGLWIIVPLIRGGSKGKIKTEIVYVCSDCGHEQKGD